MRVVLDTNVIMSGIFFGGAPGRIIEAWRSGQIEVVVTPSVLTEYERVAEALSKRYPAIEITALLRILASVASQAANHELPEPVCTDPEDDKFLACALSGNATLVISGDKALLAASGYRDIEVVSPRAFVDSVL
ncbi:MAG: putative toxin-antitoxin system toxin component, PIN family [Kiloniellales bacterium]